MPKRAHRRIAVATTGTVISLPSSVSPMPAPMVSPQRGASKAARQQARAAAEQAARAARRIAEAERLALTRAYQSQERAATREFKLTPGREKRAFRLDRPAQKQAFTLQREAQRQALRLARPGQKQQFILAKQAQKQAARFAAGQAAAAAAAAAAGLPFGPALSPAAAPAETTLVPAAASEVLTELEPEDSFDQSYGLPEESMMPGDESDFEEPDELEQEQDAAWGDELDELDTEPLPLVNEAPFERIDAGDAGSDAGAGGAAGGFELEDDEALEPLEGLGFPLVDSVTAKWNELTAWMQAQVGRFLQIKSEILNQQRVLDAAIAKAKAGGSDVGHLKDLRSRASEVLADQKDLEGQVLEQMQKISATNKSQQGVGILPLVIGAAAVSVLAYVAGKVYLQMRSWDQLNREIDLATRGVMSVSDIERLKKANVMDPLGLGNLKTLGMIALGIFVVWKVVPMITRRAAA